ncbi:replication initiation protein [Campylobacter sp. CNRCH_2013_0898h]|nr:replication initiation protein [Campylobacter sp. CNRCH_2013_0898h]MCV3554081.1 replication initiation protein [Campylobacter sp. CNRCH_2013_0898h]
MNEIVKYHNDFNKIKLPSFTEQEQNILCGMLTKIKESQTDDSIKFTPQELQKFSTENLTNKALGEMLIVLREKFFKADFTILIEDKERDLIGKEIVNLFQSFKLWYQSNDYEYSNLQSVEMTVNPRFKYLVNEITANFTAFELAEFIAISGKYTKTLYRLLKQYRSTGKAYFEWEEFKRIMDIPQNYLMHNIDKWILKPAIKELTKERTLFDQLRVPFENLTFEKKKVSARGRGGKVIGIKFIFKPENIKIQTIERQEKLSNEKKQVKIIQNLIGQKIKYQDSILTINAIYEEKEKVILTYFDETQNKYGGFNFETFEEMKEKVSKNLYLD